MGGVRILFAGSPAVALPALEAVASVATELAVMSQPDRPVGRKKVLTPTAVSSWATTHGVGLYRPTDHDAIGQAVTEFAPDLGITVAYGRILRPDVLAIPANGWWNLHFSLLPRWRGAAPVQNALFAGDTETGVTIFQLDAGMDTGPVLSQQTHAIAAGITAGALLDELSVVGAWLLTTTLQNQLVTPVRSTPQHGEATHAAKLDRDTGRVRSTDTVQMATRRFQATTPEPGCFVSWGDGQHSLRVLEASTSTDTKWSAEGTISMTPDGVGIGLAGGSLLLHSVQPAGKKPMPATDWWRGVHQTEIALDG